MFFRASTLFSLVWKVLVTFLICMIGCSIFSSPFALASACPPYADKCFQTSTSGTQQFCRPSKAAVRIRQASPIPAQTLSYHISSNPVNSKRDVTVTQADTFTVLNTGKWSRTAKKYPSRRFRMVFGSLCDGIRTVIPSHNFQKKDFFINPSLADICGTSSIPRQKAG